MTSANAKNDLVARLTVARSGSRLRLSPLRSTCFCCTSQLNVPCGLMFAYDAYAMQHSVLVARWMSDRGRCLALVA